MGHLMLVTAFGLNEPVPAVARYRALMRGWATGCGPVTCLALTTSPSQTAAVGPGIRVVGTPVEGPGGWRGQGLLALRNQLSIMKSSGAVPHAILLMDRDPVFLLGGIGLARRYGVPAIHEITEYPDLVATGRASAARMEVFRRWCLPRLDGVMVISPALETWVRARSTVPIVEIGGMVELPGPIEARTDGGPVVFGYCGSLNEMKDGLGCLIRALSSLQHSAEFRLRVIAGPHTDAEAEAILAAIRDGGLEGMVDVEGPIPPMEVHRRLSACDVLVLPRPVSRQAEAGLPTKLGEYLASGRPVITTAVGVIPRLIEPGVEAEVIAPNDVAQLSGALGRMLESPGRREEIGRAGRRLAHRLWDPKAAALRLSRFVDEVNCGPVASG